MMSHLMLRFLLSAISNDLLYSSIVPTNVTLLSISSVFPNNEANFVIDHNIHLIYILVSIYIFICLFYVKLYFYKYFYNY